MEKVLADWRVFEALWCRRLLPASACGQGRCYPGRCTIWFLVQNSAHANCVLMLYAKILFMSQVLSTIRTGTYQYRGSVHRYHKILMPHESEEMHALFVQEKVISDLIQGTPASVADLPALSDQQLLRKVHPCAHSSCCYMCVSLQRMMLAKCQLDLPFQCRHAHHLRCIELQGLRFRLLLMYEEQPLLERT